MCIVLTFVLPFITHKWGPLIALKSKKRLPMIINVKTRLSYFILLLIILCALIDVIVYRYITKTLNDI